MHTVKRLTTATILIIGFATPAATARPILLSQYGDVGRSDFVTPDLDPLVQFVLRLTSDFPDQPRALGLGRGVFWGDGDQGVVEFSSESSPFFDEFATLATNGVDDFFYLADVWIVDFVGSSFVDRESALLGGDPDFVGFDLTSVRMIVDELSIEPVRIKGQPGYELDYDIKYQFFGTVIPEPASVTFMLMAASLMVARSSRGRRRAI